MYIGEVRNSFTKMKMTTRAPVVELVLATLQCNSNRIDSICGVLSQGSHGKATTFSQ